MPPTPRPPTPSAPAPIPAAPTVASPDPPPGPARSGPPPAERCSSRAASTPSPEAMLSISLTGVINVEGSCVAVDTSGETASRIELASANGDCAADVAAVGGAVTLTGAPLTTICVVGPSNWARVTATAAVASASPSVANPTATP